MPARGPAPLLFVDTETTRLRRPFLSGGRRIWEIGARRDEPDSIGADLHLYIRIADLNLLPLLTATQRWRHGILSQHPDWYERLPEQTREVFWHELLPEDVQTSLNVGHFHQRHPERCGADTQKLVSEAQAAQTLMEGGWLDGRPVIVGAVPSFDELGLFDLLHRHGHLGPDQDLWDYHLLDAETYAAGRLGWPPPWDVEELSAAVGVDVTRFRRHCAVDDALWARALYYAASQPATVAQ